MAFIEPVGQRRRRRLVDDPQDFEACDSSGIARRGALRVVEVRRHGDDGAVDFVVDHALFGEERLRPMLQLAQDERRDFRRRELAAAESDADHASGFAADPEREMARFVADVLDAFAHEALHRVGRVAGIGQQAALRFASDVHRSALVDRHDRRHQSISALVADDDRRAVLHVCDQRVRGAEIDPDDFAHALSSLSMPPSRLLM